MSARAALSEWEDAIARLPDVALPDLPEIVILQRRFDQKFLVPVTKLPQLLWQFGSQAKVLEVAGRRAITCESVYFDTPSFRTFRDHRQRRRRRYKIRTRHYGEPAEAWLEVKVKGSRGQTVKHRRAHTAKRPDLLDRSSLEYIGAVLRAEYGLERPEDLGPTITTTFTRTTLVCEATGERITIDRSLKARVANEDVQLGRSHAIVEVKSTARRGPSVRALAGLGLRPERVSKYCVGLVLAFPELRGNPWRRAITRLAAPTYPSG